jgi:hypothetical protein
MAQGTAITRHKAFISVWASLFSTTLLLAGCASTVEVSEGKFAHIVGYGGQASFDAAVEGRLDWSEAGCLTNYSPYGDDQIYLVSLPYGSKVAETTVEFPDGKTYKIGDYFLGGGGYFISDSDSADSMGVPVACVTDEIVLINTY